MSPINRSFIVALLYFFYPIDSTGLFANQTEGYNNTPIANLTRGLCMSCHSIDGEKEATAPAFSQILKAYRLPKKATPSSIAQAIATYANNPQKTKPRLPQNRSGPQMTAIQLPQEQLLAIAQYLQTLVPPTTK